MRYDVRNVEWFKSDFRYVADYFVQMRINNNYRPSVDTIEHVDATLKLMSVLTGDKKFEEAIPKAHRIDGGVSMKSAIDIMFDEKARNLAEMMIDDGEPDEKILRYTGMSKRELEEFKKHHKKNKDLVMA